MNNLYNNDLPITDVTDDKLDREEFAKNLAKAVTNLPTYESSFTIGLIGEWGSGKTSILNLFEKNINSAQIILIKFNPWNFTEMNNLFDSFFNTLIGNLKKRKQPDKIIDSLKKYKNELLISIYALETIAPLILGISYVPPLSKIIKSLENNIRKTSPEELLEDKKEKLNKLLSKLDKKIVIIIDDIDRLTSKEVQQIFQIVKSLANFSNITYILSFDKNHIYNSLNAHQFLGSENDKYNNVAVNGVTYPITSDMSENNKYNNVEEFINKIIQIPINIPSIREEQLKEIFKEKILDTFNYYSKNTNKEIDNIINYILPYVNNIRDLNRYINLLTFNLSIIYDKIDVYDLSLLTAIQLFDNNLYKTIKNNKKLFIPYINNNEEKEKLSKILKNTSKTTNLILKELFPTIDENKIHLNRNNNRRINNYNYFDTYFTYNLDSTCISKKELDEILKIRTNTEVNDKIKELYKLGKIDSFLEELPYNIEKINNNLICGLLSINDYITEYDILSTYVSNIIYIIRQFIENNNSKECFKIIKNRIQYNNSILFDLDIIIMLKNSNLYSYEQICELKDVALEKSLKKLSEQSIPKKELSPFLHNTIHLELSKECFQIVDDNSDEELIYKLHAFIHKERNGEKVEKNDFNKMKDYFDISFIDKKLKKIKKENERIYEENKEIFNLFNENYPEENIT